MLAPAKRSILYGIVFSRIGTASAVRQLSSTGSMCHVDGVLSSVLNAHWVSLLQSANSEWQKVAVARFWNCVQQLAIDEYT